MSKDDDQLIQSSLTVLFFRRTARLAAIPQDGRLEHDGDVQPTELRIGQYFTPRTLIDSASLSSAYACALSLQLRSRQNCQATVIAPKPNEILCAPAYDTGGFLNNCAGRQVVIGRLCRPLSGQAARSFVYNALICYHGLFRACCHETAVEVVGGVAAIPDCRLGFGFPPDGGRGTGQRDSIRGVDMPEVNETKPIVAGIPDCKREPKRLGVNDAMGR